MFGVTVRITKYVEEAYPGWVECQLTDADGRTWSFIDKVPVVSQVDLDPSSDFPQPGVIACEVVERADGEVWIDTTRPWDIESAEGVTRFRVRETDLIEW